MNDYHLERFKKAQESDFETALLEIKSGRKRSHWMWYIFPQVKGLGFSETSRYYGIAGIEEAKAYLADALLRERLVTICSALLELQSKDAGSIFGFPDNLKLKSSMTLFDAADAEQTVFAKVLDKFFGGERDRKTLDILKSET